MTVYKNMATIYDAFMSEAPYDEWTNFTEKVFKKLNKQVKSIIDLGCGTGEISLRLSRRGYQVIGIDYSEEMLALAKQKSVQNKLAIDWLKQDIRNLSGLNNIDVAISYCDVINYIVEEQGIRDVFQRTFEILNQGGLFIFDFHALEYVEDELIGHSFSDVTDDLAYIWDCFSGEEIGEMFHELTFFVRDNTNKFSRFEEIHHQRTYPILFYQNLLTEIGFENIIFGADFSLESSKCSKKVERLFIIAEKKL